MAKPVQVYLDAADVARLDTWTRAQGWTKSQAIRTAIRALTRPREEDPLLSASGMIDGLPADLSEQFDRYLEETFVAKKARPHLRKRRRSSAPVRR